jgi:isoleucyl-tRNA synthetase
LNQEGLKEIKSISKTILEEEIQNFTQFSTLLKESTNKEENQILELLQRNFEAFGKHNELTIRTSLQKQFENLTQKLKDVAEKMENSSQTVKEKIEVEETIAKEQREKIFNNTNEAKNKLQEEINKTGADIKEKIEAEEKIAKEQRKMNFNNINEIKEKVINNIQVTGERIVQKLGATVQEQGIKMHGTFQVVGKMLNDKMNQRIGQLETKILQTQNSEKLEQEINGPMEMIKELIINSKDWWGLAALITSPWGHLPAHG